jgi:hypothetical protein
MLRCKKTGVGYIKFLLFGEWRFFGGERGMGEGDECLEVGKTYEVFKTS